MERKRELVDAGSVAAKRVHLDVDLGEEDDTSPDYQRLEVCRRQSDLSDSVRRPYTVVCVRPSGRRHARGRIYKRWRAAFVECRRASSPSAGSGIR